jgi:GlpG protein
MRHLGTLADIALAERLQDHLIARGIKCAVEDDQAGSAIWIYDEDRLAEAKTEFAEFQADPNHSRYAQARQQATTILKEEAAKRKAARRNTVVLSDRWRQPAAINCPLTVGMIAICLFVYVEMHVLNDRRGLSDRLYFSTQEDWSDIGQGDWWRLITPTIMHGGLLHIFFNLLWWWDFGLLIESRKGSAKFLLMVLSISLVSNVLQFQFGGPWFLGLSGVNFGLFGYLWVKGKLDPEDGLGVSQQTAQWQLVWFLLCWFGLIGRIANWCHTGGLIMGVLLAVGSTAWRRLRRH